MQEITEQNFQTEALDQKGVVIVDFYTDWCGPCKQLAPILEELSKEMKEVKFLKINAEEAANLASHYGVRSVPTLVLLKEGEVKDTITGMHPKEVLQEKIQAV
tara:strand:- start:92138 stop:92446 length:309 start_codon:yes stop_codon:yes gene_type:complete